MLSSGDIPRAVGYIANSSIIYGIEKGDNDEIKKAYDFQGAARQYCRGAGAGTGRQTDISTDSLWRMSLITGIL